MMDDKQTDWAEELAHKVVRELVQSKLLLLEDDLKSRQQAIRSIASTLRYYGISDIAIQQIAKARQETAAAEFEAVKLRDQLAKLTYNEPPF